MENNLRLAYVLNNVNAIDKSELQPYEILLDYAKSDIIVVQKDLSLFSVKNYISSITRDFLSSTHTKLSNQHLEATSTRSGFLSPTDKIKLDRCAELIKDISNILINNKAPYTIKELSFNIVNDKLEITSKVNTGGLDIVPDKTILNIGERPTDTFMNAYDRIGYRDDVVLLDVNTNIICIKYNVQYSDDTIVIDGESYNITDRFSYKCGNNEYVPLYKIRRRNNSYISENNIFGKLSDNNITINEITDIGRYTLPVNESLDHVLVSNLNTGINLSNKIHSKILLSNIKRDIDKQAFVYQSLDNTLIDLVNKQNLGKDVIYKKSPYGTMMRKAFNEGNYISFNQVEDFVLDFLIDTSSIHNDDTMIGLIDATLQPVITIGCDNSKLVVVSGDVKKTIDIDTIRKYQSIKITKRGTLINIYVNEVYKDSLISNINYMIKFLSIPAKKISLGEVMMTTNMNYVNKHVNSNVYLTDTFITTDNNPTLIKRTEQFSLVDKTKNGFTAKFSNENVLNKDDSIFIYFNNQTVNIPVDMGINIVSIDGNKISLNKIGNLKVNDIIKIFNKYDNIDNSYRINNIQNNIIYIDSIIPQKFKGYSVCKLNNCVPINISINNEKLTKIVKDDYYIQVILDKAYTSNSVITIDYVEKVDTDNSILDNINSINSIKFADKYTNTTSTLLKSLANTDITYTYKGNIITNAQKTKPIVIINDNIELSLQFNIKDFLMCYDNIESILETLEIAMDIELSGGSNDVLINNKKINTKGNILSISLNKDNLTIDEDFNVNVKISTKTGEKIGKLILDKIYVKLYNTPYKNIRVFDVRNSLNQVTDYCVITDDLLFLNSKEETKIFIEEKQDSYVIVSDYTPLTEEINGYVLANVSGNILIVHVADNRAYHLNKYYVGGTE